MEKLKIKKMSLTVLEHKVFCQFCPVKQKNLTGLELDVTIPVPFIPFSFV
jgi:hypothetical protein